MSRPYRRTSAFGPFWRGFRLLRRRGGLTVVTAARRAGVRRNDVIYSENRTGNIDFVTAGRLLIAYKATLVDLGLMAKLAEKHLGPERGLYEAKTAAILAEFQSLRGTVTAAEVPMPDPVGLLGEITRRLKPLEDLVPGIVDDLAALRQVFALLAKGLGGEVKPEVPRRPGKRKAASAEPKPREPLEERNASPDA